VAGSCEHDNKYYGLIEAKEFLDQLSN